MTAPETDPLLAEDPLADCVTVAEASKRFGVSERTIGRVLKAAGTAALPRQVERQTKSGKRSATVYAADVLAGLLQVSGEEKETGNIPATRPATVASAGIPADVVEWQHRALVAEARAQLLESERDTLRDGMTRAQENERTALAELSAARESFAREIAEVRRESAVMIAATATGQIASYGLRDAPESGDTGHSPLSTPPQAPGREPEARTSAGTGQVPAAVPTVEAPRTGTDANYSAQNNRRWWEFWKH